MNRFNFHVLLLLAVLFGQKLTAQNPTELGDIQGSTKVCAGGTFTFSVNPAVQIQEYHWSSPNGSQILGGQDSVVVFPAQGNSVQITFGFTAGQICVTAIPADHSAPLTACLHVTLAPVPVTVLPPLVLSPQECLQQFGQAACDAGIWRDTLHGQGGCDSIVEQKIFSTTCVYPLKIKGLDTLDCRDGQYHLQCTAIPAPQTCQWFLPDGTSVSGTTLTPALNGHYVLFAESPSGCPATVGFDIQAHPMPPAAAAGPDQTLPCDPPIVTLQGGNLQGSYTAYSWSGPGIYSGNDHTLTPEVTVEGLYVLTIENQQVNCVSRDTVEVIVGDAAPIAEAGPDVLFPCNLAAHPLHIGTTTTSTGAGIKYLWTSDPAGGVSANQSTKKRPIVQAPGLFTLTVNDTKKHCKKIDHVVVLPSENPTANAGADVLLDCANSTGIQLNASGSQIPSATTFSADWAGPGIDAANGGAKTPTVFLPGTYTVTVTDNATGCTDYDEIVITKSPDVPTANAGPDKKQTTANQAVTLEGSGSAGGAPIEYRWTGPGITAANRLLAQPTVTAPGNYVLRIKNLTTGCLARDRAIVFAPTTIVANDDRVGSEIFPETLRARVLPNPVEHGSQPEIFLENALPGKLTVALVSIAGNQLASNELNVAAERRAFSQKLPIVELPGYYIVKVSQGNGETVAVPMIVR